MPKLLIIGGTGSLGNVLVDKYLPKYDICIYSRDEDKQWRMKNKYNSDRITFVIGDILNYDRIFSTLAKIQPNYIIIASAMKHIDICEQNINESINTNVIGVQNIIKCIDNLKLPLLDCVLFVSTDKACSPCNVYGTCKALSEKIITQKSLDFTTTRFVVVRYGNVINSRGSLLPKFNEIANNDTKKSFTVTHKDMTRFFMTIHQSVELVDYALTMGKTGCIFVPILNSHHIIEIANLFSSKYNKPVEFSGMRPGEKMHEELINDTELQRTYLENGFYVVSHSSHDISEKDKVKIKSYTSLDTLVSVQEMQVFLNI